MSTSNEDIMESLGRIEATLPHLATKQCLQKAHTKIAVNTERIATNRKGLWLMIVAIFSTVGKIAYESLKAKL